MFSISNVNGPHPIPYLRVFPITGGPTVIEVFMHSLPKTIPCPEILNTVMQYTDYSTLENGKSGIGLRVTQILITWNTYRATTVHIALYYT